MVRSSIYRALSICKALVTRKPLALCDIGDLDGLTCAVLFKMKYREGVLVLASPSDVKNSRILRAVEWTFVADLPCPGKAVLRADHHATNTPCARQEFYDPRAPAAAVLALKALGLEDFKQAERLVKLAVETDTAKIESNEALALNDAVKGAGYRGKLRLAEMLSTMELEKVLSNGEVKKWIERYSKVRLATEKLASELPDVEHFVAVFEKNMQISYRYLSILIERKGAKFTAIIVPRSFSMIRVYLGSSDQAYDVSMLAGKLGGGGHPFAAGASIRGYPVSKIIRKVLKEIAAFTGQKELNVYMIGGQGFRLTLFTP
ncbi:MAG: DHHA1 domain-containing protein [Thermofilaceae archaeon]